MQLMDTGADAGAQTVTGADGSVYVQHQGIVYSLQMPDHSNPDGMWNAFDCHSLHDFSSHTMQAARFW